MYLLNIFNVIYMVKVITIRDEVYKKLFRVKRKMGVSFSDAIDYLIQLSAKSEHTKGLINLAGSVKERDVRKDRLRRVIKW